VNGAWRTISVALRADAGPYIAGLSTASAATHKFGRGVDDTTKRSGSAWQTFGKLVKASGAIIAVSVLAFVGAAIGAATKFEQRMSAVGAVANATAGQLDALRSKALQLGADTAFSAGEAASAMEELVKAGVSVEGVLGGAADATVALAAAGEVDLTTAATIASNAMNQFGLAAEDLPQVADLIAGAANASAIGVEDFGMSLAQAGTVANTLGLSFDDLTLAIAAMGNAGVAGSDAGTSLKTFMMRLVPSTVKAREEMERLGLIVGTNSKFFDDITGDAESYSEISQVLADSLAHMTTEQKLATLQTLFGSDAIRAAAVAADEGAAGLDKLNGKIHEIGAEEVARKRLDNLAGSVEQFKGSIETLLISSGGTFTAALRPIVDGATELVNVLATNPADFFGPLIATIRPLAPAWRDLVGAGENLVAVLDEMGDTAAPILEVLGQMGGVAVVASLRVLAAGLEGITGLLAEHPHLIQAITVSLITLAAVQTFHLLAGAAETFAIKVLYAGDAIKGLAIAGQLQTIGTGFATMGTNATIGLAQIRVGLAGIAASLATIAPVAAVASVVALGMAWNKAKDDAREALDAMKPRGFDERSIKSLSDYGAAVNGAWGKATEAADGQNTLTNAIKGTVEALTPMENSVLNTFGTLSEAKDAAEENSRALGVLQQAYTDVAAAVLGLKIPKGKILALDSADLAMVEDWVKKLDLDPATMSVDAMAGAITAAKNAAEHGTPATDGLMEAYKVLADQTANSTEQLGAWKKAVDSAMGVKANVFDATTAFGGSIDDLTQSFTENGWGMFDPDSEAGRKNRQAAQQARDDAVALAEAYGGTAEGVAAANSALEGNRQRIIEAGMAAGVSREQMEAYVDEIGLTPEVVQTLVGLEGTEGALSEIEKLTKPRVVPITFEVTAGASIAGIGASLPHRAAGGKVWKDVPTVVGEHRPEVFMPGQDGWIFPSIGAYQRAAGWGQAPVGTSQAPADRMVPNGGGGDGSGVVRVVVEDKRAPGGKVGAIHFHEVQGMRPRQMIRAIERHLLRSP
jgi:TP901 family phage tail tape measure protein